MYDEVVAMEAKDGNKPVPMDILKGGGYYIIPDVRMSKTSNEFVDIWIIVEKVDDKRVAEKMNEYSTVNPATGTMKIMKKPTLLDTTEKKKPAIFWDDIKEGLTGCVRLVHYKNHSNVYGQVDDFDKVFEDKMVFKNHDDASLEIYKIEEGRFEKGIKNGYVRVLSSENEGTCELGFFVDGSPKGKHVFY